MRSEAQRSARAHDHALHLETAQPAPEAFVAFSSADSLVADTIVEACSSIKSSDIEYHPWNRNDVSGQPIDRSVFGWVEEADSFVANISEPNHNVTYEIGLAIGMAKPLRLIRAANKDRKILEEIGLLHNIGHNDYPDRAALATILTKTPPVALWPAPKRNKDQPIYLVEPSVANDLLIRVASGVKKIIKLKFRAFNPREIDRLTATEAFEQVGQSFGVIAIWADAETFRQYQRAAFTIGLARGMDIAFLLIAHKDQRLPLDLDEVASRWSTPSDIDALIRDFREQVLDSQQTFTEARARTERFLDLVYCGDPAAENEATQLDEYFLSTEQYRLTLNGELNILLGRKGTGKTAIFLQVRDKIRADRRNIVLDLQPVGFQLVKLKEFVITQLSYGTRKEFIAAFWEYIVWLEIAYKLLEKDAPRVRVDSRLFAAYDRLNAAYKQRVEGSGDFSERLTRLTDLIIGRYEASQAAGQEQLPSSKLLEIVYGTEIHNMRDEVMSYLKLKGVVFFLFDNLDRFWTPSGFVEVDSLIVIGLIESLQEIRRVFARNRIDFFWAIFLRSDVYEFVVKGMADYGKVAVAMGAWRGEDTRGQVVNFLDQFRTRLTLVRVDAIGIGHNFGLHLRDCRFPVELVNVGMPCESKPERGENDPARRFVNLRASDTGPHTVYNGTSTRAAAEADESDFSSVRSVASSIRFLSADA